MIAVSNCSHGVPGVVAVVAGINARTAEQARRASRLLFKEAEQQRRAGKHEVAEIKLEDAERISRLAS